MLKLRHVNGRSFCGVVLFFRFCDKSLDYSEKCFVNHDSFCCAMVMTAIILPALDRRTAN